MTTTMAQLKRLPPTEFDEEPRYFHPNGWVIVRWTRSWDERVGAVRGASFASPRRAWEIYAHIATRPEDVGPRYLHRAHWLDQRHETSTLREARAWCDEHDGWSVGR